MRISKIIAGMSAMAIASVMAVSASANTLTVANPSDKEWDGFAKYTNAEGKEDNDIVWGGSLTRDQALTVTVNFEWTEKGSTEKWCAFKPGYADGWNPLFADAAPEGWTESSSDSDDDGRRLNVDGNFVDYSWQNDGWLHVDNSEVSSVTFTVPVDIVNTIYDNATAEEGFDGIVFQVGNNGMKITSIDFDQDVKWFSEVQAEQPADESKADESKSDSSKDESKADSSKADESKADSSKADSSKASTTTTTKTTTTTTGTSSAAAATSSAASDNTNTATGATAGIALAGLALAGAVAVVSKRK